jgi:hypothetical protein
MGKKLIEKSKKVQYGDNNKFSVIGLTRSPLEPTIYPTRGEDANDYTTYAVRNGFSVHLSFYSPGCKTT